MRKGNTDLLTGSCMVDKKDTEIRVQERKVSDTADKKDSEKRQFNWKLIEAASYVALIGVGILAAALGTAGTISSTNMR